MTSEHTSRTRKALAIADRLSAVHCDSATAARLTDAAWRIAAAAAAAHIAVTEHTAGPGWVDASERTRGMVIGILADREQTTVEDLFAAIAGTAPIPPVTVPAPDPVDEHLSGKVIEALVHDLPTRSVTHYKTASSTVRCGALMGHWRDNPTGWDLGTVTVDPSKVTCPDCARLSGRVMAALAAVAPAPGPVYPMPVSSLHTLNCIASGGRCRPGAPCTDPPFIPAHRRNQETK